MNPAVKVPEGRLQRAAIGLLLLLVLLPGAVRAQSRAEKRLARRIDEIITRGNARKALWGIEVYSLDRNRIIYSHNSERYFTPASVTKLFTIAAALDLLGEDHRFRTTVEARGKLDDDGRLLGDIRLVGRGDPDLAGCTLPYVPPPPPGERPPQKEEDAEEDEEEESCPFEQNLDKLAAQVAARGVRQVTGNLVVDTSYFSPEPYGEGWEYEDLVWSYGASVRALSFADNVITLKVEPGDRVGAKGKVSWEPFTRQFEVRNGTWTIPAGLRTQLYVRRDPGKRELDVLGPIALGRRPRYLAVALEEPAEAAGEFFVQALARAGVQVQGKVEVIYALAPPHPFRSEEDSGEVLAEHLSLPLSEDARLILKNSQNLHTELLLRLMGRNDPPETGEEVRPPLRSRFAPPPRRADGSAEAGIGVLRTWLANAGLDLEDISFKDGSGLSQKNLVTPHAVVGLLRHVVTRPWAGFYIDSLPVAGRDGTLSRRMRRTAAEGRVRAKTGTLAGNIALAGVVDTRSGERLLFAVFLNHHRLVNSLSADLIDDICVALAELPAPPKRKEK
jgi:D-alanyl-D-alanine carboxypeptidase/D-alanyl-D-alanine-endopeptidase (penicillin-binding protein 4)